MNQVSLFIIAIILKTCESSSILAVLPVPSKSHQFMFQPIIKELAARGHNVTIISPFKIDSNLTNLNQIVVHSSAENYINEIDYAKILELGNTPLFIPPKMSFWFYGLMMCEDYLKSDQIQKIINSRDYKFDLILLEALFGQESLIGFGKKFNAPAVLLSSNINHLFLDEIIGNSLSLSLIPHAESQFTSPMTFYQRAWNLIRSSVVLTWGYYFYLPEQEALMNRYFNFIVSDSTPSIIDMLRNNVSLVIANGHVTCEYSRPMVPSVINAAGLHINENPNNLPKDLQEFMDGSLNGVVYFSLGTIVPAHKLPAEQINAFLVAFSKLKQRVLWKANVESMENLPKNVKIGKWFPQQAILAHPNCKAFITHGGLLSLQEAIYFGIPLVGIPFFSDQHTNIGRAVNIGFAVKLNCKNLTSESIQWAVTEVVLNTQYSETAKKYSRIFRDNPVKPLDNAIFWIEYVIRHGGAQHLRSSKLNLTLFQYLFIDVILFIICVLIAVVFCVYLVIKFMTKLMKNRSDSVIKNKKKS